MKLPVLYNALEPTEKRKVREEYIRLQEGKCYYCKESLDSGAPIEVISLPIIEKVFPPNFFHFPVHLHHSHETGLTLGAVHCYCNAVLWQYHGE